MCVNQKNRFFSLVSRLTVGNCLQKIMGIRYTFFYLGFLPLKCFFFLDGLVSFFNLTMYET